MTEKVGLRITFRNAPPKIKHEDFVLLMKKFEKKLNILLKKKGICIENSLDIENTMGMLIRFVLFGTDFKKHDEFNDLFSSSDFFTFSQKKRIVEKILFDYRKLFPKLNNEKARAIAKNMETLISDRNKLAHGVIIFDVSTKKPYLRYSGKKEIELSNDFFNKFDEKFLVIDKELRELIAVLRDKTG